MFKVLKYSELAQCGIRKHNHVKSYKLFRMKEKPHRSGDRNA